MKCHFRSIYQDVAWIRSRKKLDSQVFFRFKKELLGLRNKKCFLSTLLEKQPIVLQKLLLCTYCTLQSTSNVVPNRGPTRLLEQDSPGACYSRLQRAVMGANAGRKERLTNHYWFIPTESKRSSLLIHLNCSLGFLEITI